MSHKHPPVRRSGPSRGSRTGRPIMVLFDILGKRWTLRILWELRESRCKFRDLQSRCEEISPTVLNQRLKELRALALIDHDDGGYGLTRQGEELGSRLLDLSEWAESWLNRGKV